MPPILTLPLTLSEERVPTDVIFGCAAVCSVPVGFPVNAPTNVVAVTTPALPSLILLPTSTKSPNIPDVAVAIISYF